MKKIQVKMCCFSVNYTHSCIIANNFIKNNLDDYKVIYMNEKKESKKLDEIIDKFYKKIKNKAYFTEWLNENNVNDYENEKFVFVINGKTEFIHKVRDFLDLNDFEGYIISCYEVFEAGIDINKIINEHDYYINTTGVMKKDLLI